MTLRNIHEALAQVRAVKQRVLESGRFHGYSGRARALGGMCALVAGAALGCGWVPRTDGAHLVGWSLLLLAGLALNYGALLWWYRSEPTTTRDRRQLLPVLDPMAPLAVGAVLSLALIDRGLHDLLFGVWMCLYGLCNLSARWVMPRGAWTVGLYYLLAGMVCLVHPGITFLDPWPMAAIFAVGELGGGVVFYCGRAGGCTLRGFLGLG